MAHRPNQPNKPVQTNHPHPDHHDLFENRKQFQLERLILFSDAVFAIAITLLVIEIKVPELPDDTPNRLHALKEALAEKFPEFFGLVLSFAVIGQFWNNHHRLFGNISNYNGGLIWLNLLMLFWIILVPFTSGLNSRFGDLNFVWQVYSFNLFMIGISLYLLYRYIGNPKHGLSDLANDPISKKMAMNRSLGVSFVFLLGGILAYWDGPIMRATSRCIYFIIPIVMVFITKYYKKKRQKMDR